MQHWFYAAVVATALALPSAASAQNVQYNEHGYITQVGGYQHCAYEGETCGSGPTVTYEDARAFADMRNGVFHLAYGSGPELSEEYYQFAFVFDDFRSGLSNNTFRCNGATFGFEAYRDAHCLLRRLGPQDVTGVYNAMDCGQWGTECAANGLAVIRMQFANGQSVQQWIWSGKIRCTDSSGNQAACRMAQIALKPDFYYNGQGRGAETVGSQYPNGPIMLEPWRLGF